MHSKYDARKISHEKLSSTSRNQSCSQTMIMFEPTKGPGTNPSNATTLAELYYDVLKDRSMMINAVVGVHYLTARAQTATELEQCIRSKLQSRLDHRRYPAMGTAIDLAGECSGRCGVSGRSHVALQKANTCRVNQGFVQCRTQPRKMERGALGSICSVAINDCKMRFPCAQVSVVSTEDGYYFGILPGDDIEHRPCRLCRKTQYCTTFDGASELTAARAGKHPRVPLPYPDDACIDCCRQIMLLNEIKNFLKSLRQIYTWDG